MIAALIFRDLRRGLTGSAWLPMAFFLLVVALMPFAIGPDARLLSRIGSGTLWIAALTAALLPVERLIEPDRADGVLDQLAVHGLAALAVAIAAVTCGLPRAGSLAGLLLLPLAVPLLIFGAANAVLLEAAISLLLTAGAPFVAGAAIRAART
jgi:heme exporter protein B